MENLKLIGEHNSISKSKKQNWVLTLKILSAIIKLPNWIANKANLRSERFMQKRNSERAMQILDMEVNEPQNLREECVKYGIEYNEPSFHPVMVLVTEDYEGLAHEIVDPTSYEVAIPYFYLNLDIGKSENLRKAIEKFEKAFWYYQENENTLNPVKVVAKEIKYYHALRQLCRIEKKENIKRFSSSEVHRYLDKYREQKKQELEKVKAKIEKEEMTLTK